MKSDNASLKDSLIATTSLIIKVCNKVPVLEKDLGIVNGCKDNDIPVNFKVNKSDKYGSYEIDKIDDSWLFDEKTMPILEISAFDYKKSALLYAEVKDKNNHEFFYRGTTRKIIEILRLRISNNIESRRFFFKRINKGIGQRVVNAACLCLWDKSNF